MFRRQNIKFRIKMEYTDKEYCIEVWGDYACFTRPELKVERVSYDVITPSAARAIFEAILFKKYAMRWQVTKIEVLNPIKWVSVRRNESPGGIKMAELISLIVPCYNEEPSLPYFWEQTAAVMQRMDYLDFEVIFVDDGSRDKTLEVLRGLAKSDSRVKYLSFSRNFGKEAAMYAGLEHARYISSSRAGGSCRSASMTAA